MELPRWKRAWLWVMLVSSVANIGWLGYGIMYLDAHPVFGAFAVVLCFVVALPSALVLFPKQIEDLLPGSLQQLLWVALVSFPILVFATVCAFVFGKLF